LLKASGPVYQPVTVITLLKKHGLSLREAHSVMNRIADGKPAFVELHTHSPEALAADLSRLGVAAYGTLSLPPVKIGQDYQINSTSTVHYSFAFA
jgi:hypothetical protein